MGIPINDAIVHNLAGTCMIGKLWKQYKEIKSEPEWSLTSTFNVMQCFFYLSSLAFKGPNEKRDALNNLRYLKTLL